MSIFLLFLFALIYFPLTAIGGKFLLARLGIDTRYLVLDFFLGFIIIEFVSFLLLIVTAPFGASAFFIVFIPNFLLLIASIRWAGRTPGALNSHTDWRSGDWAGILALSLGLIAFYLMGASGQLHGILTGQGIIYQDIVYHTGIVNAILEFGFPVPDMQYAGKELHYHYFTHFMAAKYSWASRVEPMLSFHILLNVVGIFFYAALSYLTTDFFLSRNGKAKPALIVIVALVVYFSGFLLGGSVSSGLYRAFFFSPSYQFQVILFLAVIMLTAQVELHQIKTTGVLVVFILVFGASVVTKVSSLPLLLAGLGAWGLHRFLQGDRATGLYWTKVVASCSVAGLVLLFVFFLGDGHAGSVLGFSYELPNKLPVVAYLKLRDNVLALLVFFAVTISYRIVLLRELQRDENWFAGAMLLTGMTLALLVTDNQVYFLYPAIVLTSHIAICQVYLIRQRQWVFYLLLLMLVCSLYPVASLGLWWQKRLNEKKNYYPITEARSELFRWVHDHTTSGSILFTPSVYATEGNTVPDNFYPAALSGRKYWLGGYRFGGLEFQPDFRERLLMVEEFTPQSAYDHKALLSKGISFVVVERLGNTNPNVFDDCITLPDNALYERVFQNSAGAVLRVK